MPSLVRAATTRTATGIRADQRCAAATRTSMDKLNRLAGRAKIRWAVCSADGSLETVGLRAVDGREKQWKAAEGKDELARRMMLGR
jgi:hypothetical protein